MVRPRPARRGVLPPRTHPAASMTSLGAQSLAKRFVPLADRVLVRRVEAAAKARAAAAARRHFGEHVLRREKRGRARTRDDPRAREIAKTPAE